MIRRMRANLLDELQKQYTVTAKAKGMKPMPALLKYPFRMALNPFVADIGNLLPHLVSGSVLVSLVLSLPTVGPVLLQALKQQDQYPGRLHPDVRRGAHRDRHADLRPAAGRRSTRASASESEAEHERRPDAHHARSAGAGPLRQSRAVRRPTRRGDDAPRRRRFYRASSMQAHLVEVQAPQGGAASRHLPAASLYVVLPFVEFIAPYGLAPSAQRPPLRPAAGRAPLPRGPLRRALRLSLQLQVRPRDASGANYVVDRTTPQPLRFFCEGEPLRVLGRDAGRLPSRLPARRTARSSCSAPTSSGATCSRASSMARGSRSRWACIGIAVSFVIGLTLGGLAGYIGGWVDAAVQRLIEILRSLPELPLWLALSAALPANWSPIARVLRHHADPRPARLAGPGPGGALQAAVAARGGFRPRGRADGRLAGAHHRRITSCRTS